MAWTEDIYPHIQTYDPHTFQIFPAPQQPTTILQQQLPATVMPPYSAPSIRPGGHVKEELVELMMIQNAQMHQVIVNNMTMAALGSLGYFSHVHGTEPRRDPVLNEENDADPEVHHHYYEPAAHLSSPPRVLPQATAVDQGDLNKPSSAPPRSDRLAVTPPPPSPGTSGTPVADSAPAAETSVLLRENKSRRENHS